MPLTIPILALLFVFYTPTDINFYALSNSLYFIDDSMKRFFLNAFGLFGWVFPVLSILILKMTKQVETVELDLQKQRTTPLFLSGVFGLMLLILLFKFNTQVTLSRHLFALVISGVLMAFIFLFINLKFKISLHAGGVGLLLAFVMAYYLEQPLKLIWPLYVVCIICGLVIASRIWLQKHTNSELFFGFIFGFIITFATDLISVQFL